MLRALSASDFQHLRPHLDVVALRQREVLERPQEPKARLLPDRHASIVARSAKAVIEVALDGMTGLHVVLGATTSPNELSFKCRAKRGQRVGELPRHPPIAVGTISF